MLLKPSFWRSTLTVLAGLICVTFLGYFYQGYSSGTWWSAGYFVSLLIPILLFPIFIWFMFVPTHLENADGCLIIAYTFRRRAVVPWSKLKFWGASEAVFLLKFEGSKTFQIFPRAYPRQQWQQLSNFLSEQFPENKAPRLARGKRLRTAAVEWGQQAGTALR